MKEKAFICCVLILLVCHAFAQSAVCPSAKISLSVLNADTLKYQQVNTFQVVVANAGDTDASIKRISASQGFRSFSCESYQVRAKESKKCQVTVSPIPDKELLLQVDYDYFSCGRTRAYQAQIQVVESRALAPAESAQVYAINVHEGCENSYYACSAPDNSGEYSAGYKCYNKEEMYYSPARERVNLKYDLPAISPMIIYGASLKLSVSAVNKMQSVSVYSASSSWKPVSCVAGGDICTQPYCGECKDLFDASGSMLSVIWVDSGGDISFDVTDAVNKAYSSGQKTLSLQIRGTEDPWASAGKASCSGNNAWVSQDVIFYGNSFNGPRLILNYPGKEINPQASFADEICNDCCKPGDMTCSVVCDGGTRNFDGSPAITDCQYLGGVITVWSGTSSQSQNCVNGRCSGSIPTTMPPGPTTMSPPTTHVPVPSGDICVNCCRPGDMDCTVTCQGGTNTISGSPAITACRYNGQTIYITRGSNSQQSGCVKGRCSGSVTTTLSPTSSSPVTSSASTTNPITTTTLSTGTCIDGTPVGQCSFWVMYLRCVDNPAYGPTFEYDTSCGSAPTTIPTPTIPPTTLFPTPMDFCFGTPVGDCSTFMDCFRCVDDSSIGLSYLDYDDTCCGSSTTFYPTTYVTTTYAPTTFVTTSFVTTTYVSTTFTSTTASVTTTTTVSSTTQATTTSSTATTTTLSSCVPSYNPGRWNNDLRALNCNNCYNYGCDKETDNFAQPGYAHGYRVALECSSVIQGANADGLKYLGKTGGPCTGCMHKVALVVAPGDDFHWYRLDDNGRWSHKPGSTTVRNVDNSGNKITNPETADRGIYTSFCGYFCVDKTAVSIAGGSSCPY